MSQDLARRAVACPVWRWLPGMLAKHPDFRDVRVSHVGRKRMHGACRYASPMGRVSHAVVALPLPTSSDVLPDLTDPATLGCLLALVREAWKDPTLTTVGTLGGWWVESYDEFCGSTEAAALVAALEAVQREDRRDAKREREILSSCSKGEACGYNWREGGCRVENCPVALAMESPVLG